MDSPSDLRASAQRLQVKIKSLLNNQLKELCKREGLQVSGVKAALQNRLFERLDDLVETDDKIMFNTFRGRVNELAAPQKSAAPYTNNGSSSTPAHPHLHSSTYPTMPNGYRSVGVPVPSHVASTPRLNFKESPFYTILEPLTQYVDLPVLTSNRHSANASFTLSPANIERLRTDKALRIVLYCAVDTAYSAYPVDIAFPNQIDVRVNQEQFAGNLRGIKKKPGTTRPADITDLSQRRSNNSTNTVNVTYAATDRVHNPSPSKYCMVVYLVRKHSVEELVDRIKRGNKIAKQTVINEMLSRANDPDIVTTSSKMSLKCPLSTMRMTLPVRSINCNHNRCFDASSFLQTQEQAPQWSCPICNNTCRFESLAIDDYAQDILSKVKSSVDEVTIEPDGQWHVEGTKEEARGSSASTSWRQKSSEADDLFEISEVRTNGYGPRVSTPQSSLRTPQLDSREPSRAASSVPRSNKRAAEEVVDLTLDSDDDEPPRRPVKRQSTGSYLGSSGYAPSNLPPKPPPPTQASYSFSMPPLPSHTGANGYSSHGYGSWN